MVMPWDTIETSDVDALAEERENRLELMDMADDLMEDLLEDTEPTLLQVMHCLRVGGFREGEEG